MSALILVKLPEHMYLAFASKRGSSAVTERM